jgi:hypothetical protein
MGLTLGLIGAGGSILTIPILVFLFRIPIIVATTYSLIIVGSVAFVAAIRYRGNILFKNASLFALPSLIGVFCSRFYILPNLPHSLGIFSIEQLLIILLLVFICLASFFMIKDHQLSLRSNNIMQSSLVAVLSLGLGFGCIIGILGAGGGFLIVPTLVLLMSFTMQEAIATSLFIITINSLVGFLSDQHTISYHNWVTIYKYLCISLIGMFVGIYLNKYINGNKLKIIFGWFILIIGITIFIKEFILI